MRRPARIDGTLDQNVAVELESRASKQVRGAVLDLLCHSYPKKLLVLLPVHMSDVEVTARQCEFIFSKFLDGTVYRVLSWRDVVPNRALRRTQRSSRQKLKNGYLPTKAPLPPAAILYLRCTKMYVQ